MIIYDGEKYACVSCIRGHRSSTCRHTNRMLVKVRNRGRHGSLDIRKVIIVDTDSQVRSKEKSVSCDNCTDNNTNSDGKECEKMNKQPILFLKTIRTQKAVLSDGKLNIIVEEDDGTSDSNTSGSKGHPPSYKYLSEKEFLRQYSIDLGNYGLREACACQSKTSSETKSETEIKPEPMTKIESNEPSISSLPFKSEQETHLQSCHNPLLGVPNGVMCQPSNNVTQMSGNRMGNERIMSNNLSQGASNGYHMDNASIQGVLNQKPMVELLTHKGLYLSTQCSCPEGNCLCENCLLHRNEEELSSYIQQSGVPLTNLGEAQLANSNGPGHCIDNCKCAEDECLCNDCLQHPTDILTFNRLLFHGIFNVHLKKKTIINYKGRLIPSQYWWDFLKLQVPLMTDTQLDSLDIIAWFESIISTYSSQLIDINSLNVDPAPTMFSL